jgi:hypothetical protein
MSTSTRLIDDTLFGNSIDELDIIDSDLIKKIKTNKKRKLTTIIPSLSSSSSSSSNIVSNYYNNGSHDLDSHDNINYNRISKSYTSKSSPSSSSSSTSSILLKTDINNDNNNDNFNPNFHNMFKNNKNNMVFIWLELNGTTCYSNKQLNSGIDLTNIKKKYRNMKCTYCSEYNPSTPWATMWPRKFELQTLVDHARSTHHNKAESIRNESLGLFVNNNDNENNNYNHNRDDHNNHDNHHHSSIDINNYISSSNNLPDSKKNKVNIKKHDDKAVVIEKSHSTRGDLRPLWLYTEGKLCLSSKQQLAFENINNNISSSSSSSSSSQHTSLSSQHPSSLSSIVTTTVTKKKYKLSLCLICQTYAPGSTWSVLKTRKFESSVLADHEKSRQHLKAVEQQSQMGQLTNNVIPYQQHHHPDNNNTTTSTKKYNVNTNDNNMNVAATIDHCLTTFGSHNNDFKGIGIEFNHDLNAASLSLLDDDDDSSNSDYD